MSSSREDSAALLFSPAVYKLVDRSEVVNGLVDKRGRMTFREATDVLTDGVSLAAIAREAGVSDGAIRQARLAPENPSYRNPPAGWEEVAVRIARQRIAELQRVVKALGGRSSG